MNLKRLMALGAIVCATGTPCLAGNQSRLLPTHKVPLLMYVNNVDNGPVVTWPEGLYDSAAACKAARKAIIGPDAQITDTGSPYATFCCLGPSGAGCQTVNWSIVKTEQLLIVPTY